MATQRPALDAALGAFAGQLLTEREVAPRAQMIAAEASSRVNTSVIVYLFDETGDPRWTSRASVGKVKAPAQCEALTLAMLAEQREPLLFSGEELVREHYAHLDVRRTVTSLAYVPLLNGETLLGAIEAVSLDRVLTRSDLAEVVSMAELSSGAIAGALAYEAERNSNFETITRLTSFYDIEKVFHSTLQMDRLLPIIASKVRELLPCGAVNVWMVEEETLALYARDGEDPTCAVGDPENDVVKYVSEHGKGVLIKDANHPLLKSREPRVVRGVLTVPIVESGSLVGVIECLNKDGGKDFDDDDYFLLGTIAETAAGALHNASLLEAERKIEILETLVEVSQEITATLNLHRVIQVLVNAPQRIMHYDRAAVALEEKGKIVVKAISGKPEVVQTDPQVKPLRDMLEWAVAAEDELYVTVAAGKVVADREETQTKFTEYFKQAGQRSWYSLPLADDQGRMGILVFESRKPDFLTTSQMELIKVLAAQATVAVRNASLYTEVPFIGMLEPILHKKQQFMRLGSARRKTYYALAIAALVLLVVVPLPMRVTGNAKIAPQTKSEVQAPVDGVIGKVYVHEGDRVARGTILADMIDWEARATLAEAQARHETALAAMNRALAANDGTEAGIQRVQADVWSAEMARQQARLDAMKIRSAIEGIVATPHTEDLAGKKLTAGDPLMDVVNVARASIDVAIDESDVSLLENGSKAVVKLEGFPTRRFVGQVDVISPTSTAEADRRVFFARVNVPNNEGLLRPGMEGYSKLSVGWRPAGYVLFRDLGLWSWNKLWKWFGW